MNTKSTLHWSIFSAYENCPQQVLWARGWGDIDVGGGPGNPKPLPARKSRHREVLDSVLYVTLAKLYNDELWASPQNLSENLFSFLSLEWSRQAKDPRNSMNLEKYGVTTEELLGSAQKGVSGYLQTMKAHSLLSFTYARAGVELLGWIDKWSPVGGKADIIIRRADTGVTLLDVRNTKHRGTADVDQLRWYGLLYLLSYKEMPDRLGIVWLQHPHGAPSLGKGGEPLYNADGSPRFEEGVEWVSFTRDDFRGIAARVLDAKKGMWKEKFEPVPSPPYCRKCAYESVCAARQAQRKANAGKRTRKTLSEIESSGGFSDFSP